MIETYNFALANATTYLGLIGIASSGIILLTAYRRYWSSPYRK